MNFGQTLDRTIAVVAPGWAMRRAAARVSYEAVAGSHAGRTNSRPSYGSGNPAAFAPDFLNPALVQQRIIDRAAARDLYDTNGTAEGMVAALVDNIIGTGLTVASLDPKYAEVYDKWFERWAKKCDVIGRSLWMLQRDWFIDAYLCGDAALIKLGDGRVQLVPGDDIADPYKVEDADKPYRLTDGVVHTGSGELVAFYVRDGLGFKRFAAADVIFWVYRRKRSNDVRGTPAFGTTYGTLHQHREYREALAVSMRLAACMSVVIKTKKAGAVLKNAKRDPEGRRQQKIQPGQIMYIEPDEEADTISPPQPGPQYGEVTNGMKRDAFAPDRLPLEIGANDFSTGPFSAAQAAIAQFKTRVQTTHDTLIFGPYAELYVWRINKAIGMEEKVDGVVLPKSENAGAHQWFPFAIPYLNPQVEHQAALMAMDGNLITFVEYCESRGKNWRKQILDREMVQDFSASHRVTFAASSATRPPDAIPASVASTPDPEQPDAEPTADPELPATGAAEAA